MFLVLFAAFFFKLLLCYITSSEIAVVLKTGADRSNREPMIGPAQSKCWVGYVMEEIAIQARHSARRKAY